MKTECDGAPPNGLVWWTVVHASGESKRVMAQTAYCAIVRECGWTFSEVVSVARVNQ
jgi:hypothetical protein